MDCQGESDNMNVSIIIAVVIVALLFFMALFVDW